MTQTRVPAGVPTGGRFAASARTEPVLTLRPGVGTIREVRDSHGDPIEIIPGVIDDNAEWVYRNGQCLALAVAVSEHTGWPVHLRTFTDGDGYEDGEPVRYTNLRHAYVETPDGTLLDISGEHDPVIVDEDARDFDGEAYRPGRTVPADRAHALLVEFEGYLEEQDVEVATTFVEPVVNLREA